METFCVDAGGILIRYLSKARHFVEAGNLERSISQ